MSLHIIKCKTILKINEIETINLTQYLNFYRHMETGGENVWGCVCACVHLGTFSAAPISTGLSLLGGGDLARSEGSQEVGANHVNQHLTSSWPKSLKA